MIESQAIQYACLIQALVTRTLGDYAQSNDGFCEVCPNHGDAFRSSGASLTYVLDAVKEKLLRDGHTLYPPVLEEIAAVEQLAGIAPRPPIVVDPGDASTLVTTVYKAQSIGKIDPIVPNMVIRAIEPMPHVNSPDWARAAQEIHEAAGRSVADALFHHLPGGTVDQILRALFERRASLLAVKF